MQCVGRLVLSIFGLKFLSRYILGCNCYFLFVFLSIYFLVCCSAAILPFTIILLLYLGFQFMLLLQLRQSGEEPMGFAVG